MVDTRLPEPRLGDNPPPSNTPVTELVSGILQDGQRLFKQQVDMLKSEFHEDLQRTKRALVYGSLGAVLLTVGGLTLVAAIVALLEEQAHLKVWQSALIVGGVLVAGGAWLGLAARALFESFNPLPDKTFNALQENLTWKTN